jgi:hypothetical protein
LKSSREFFPRTQAFAPGKSLGLHSPPRKTSVCPARAPRTLARDGEALSSVGASPFQHQPAAFRGHSLAKPVRASRTNAARFVGEAHVDPLLRLPLRGIGEISRASGVWAQEFSRSAGGLSRKRSGRLRFDRCAGAGPVLCVAPRQVTPMRVRLPGDIHPI